MVPIASDAVLAGDETQYVRDVKPILARHCVSCHGGEKPRGGLRLDTAEAALRGGKNGPVIERGHADDSRLIETLSADPSERMPLKRPPLSKSEIDSLRAWIESGAPAPQKEVPSAGAGVHWAFIAPARRDPPAVKLAHWPINPIDGFILAALERNGLEPSPEASRTTLIRRVSLDLIGLPPTAEEVEAFRLDNRPDAYELLVDRLLASPHFGERWARPWLDLARYADSNGYSIDAPRSIWKYRDWVISAFNRDLPFDQFVVDQLAGDLLPHATLEERVATGFHRNTPINQEGGIDVEQFRVESVIDRVNTTSSAFLGLTIGCAQCHDHKYDPISQQEYYQLFAFFNQCDEPEMAVATPEQVAARDRASAAVKEYLERIQADDPALLKQQRDWEIGLDMEGRQKQSQEVREAFDTPFEKRPAAKNQVVFAAFVDQSKDAKIRKHRQHIAGLRKKAPKIDTTLVVKERSQKRPTHLLIQGDFTRPGPLVSPGVPRVLPALGAGEDPTRLDFARWLVDPRNPLTARVTVNRFWQAYFGRGLVETENDFGTQGALPTHPELLDWLATEFIGRGWSMKAIHRLIVTSATYRQASLARADAAAIDPANQLLARQNRLRLDAELVRDSALRASGLFNPAIGGPSVFPPQPDGVMTLGQMRRDWKADAGPNRYRRGLYTFFWRATPHPLLMVFDAPDATRACTRRVRSNTPLQALTLLNDEAFYEFAQALADRVLRESPADESARLRLLFRLCFARDPSVIESRRLVQLLAEQRNGGGSEFPAGADSFAGDAERRAWTALARVALNLDEFITRE